MRGRTSKNNGRTRARARAGRKKRERELEFIGEGLIPVGNINRI
jgi:hypothetical protein